MRVCGFSKCAASGISVGLCKRLLSFLEQQPHAELDLHQCLPLLFCSVSLWAELLDG